MGFHLDHFTIEQTFFSALANAFLQALDQGLVLLHGAGAHGNVVVFGKHPGIEIGRHIGAHIHFSKTLIVLHLFRGQLDALLEGDRHVVIAGIHGLGDPAIGPIGTDDHIHDHVLGHTGGLAGAVIGVVQGVGTLALAAGINLGHQAIHEVGAQFSGPVTQEGIHDLPATHADVFVLVFKIDVHLTVRGRNHLHIAHFTINDRFGEIKLLDHAEGMAPPQGLALSSFRSKIQVSIPALASTSAAQEPLGPPPTTATRNILKPESRKASLA
jgi:hypothetical protein